MRTHLLASICGGLILTTISIGAHSDVGSSLQIDRAHKGDRLPIATVIHDPKLDRLAMRGHDLPEGCDALVSPLADARLARIAGRCQS
jgi:hypothetical protein